MLPMLLMLAQAADSNFGSWADLAKAGGPICIFLLLFVACIIALSKWVWIPMTAQKNAAEDARRKDTIEIAAKFESASNNLTNAVAQLRGMHDRCHEREQASKND